MIRMKNTTMHFHLLLTKELNKLLNMRTLIIWFLLITAYSTQAQTMLNIPIQNGNIHVTTYGGGEPILIINGGPGMNSNGFVSLAQELGKTHLAILYDQRGTGKSTISEINSETMTMDLMVSDIEIIRQYFGFENWIVLGHSFGGMLASYYLKKQPERIRGLILSGSGGFDLNITRNLNLLARLSETERDSLNYWNQRINQGDTTYLASYNRGKYLAPAYVYDRKHVPVIAERLTQGNSVVNSLIWQNMRAIEFNCRDGYRNFTNPVLIIQGKQDVMGNTIAREAHKLLENSELVFLNECVHYGWLEQPEGYFEAIHRFLSNF
ncbi:alpha/beta hydrolase [Hanstruepera neustonica]|uniref:Alpha/beta hydrolase n=2 Tax=Hanstruepera neustonica TaxID=1445657 RepID=A0A2K1E0Z6_9FLAO|nr:alpha/beta hydrolase [Hanstruepera neustonica]